MLPLLFWGMGLGGMIVAAITARRMLAPSPCPPAPQEAVAVILPCRGLEPAFTTFLATLAAQRLPCYRLYFVAAHPADPAVAAIQRFLAGHPGLGRLIVHAPPYGYEGKIANMLGGMEAAIADGAAYLVFLDTDILPDPDFLAHLLAPLQAGAMLSTGARLLAPAQNTLAQWMASLWLQGSLPGVTQPQWGSAWGGAMAIRTSDAQRLVLAQVWRGAFSDDHTLSRAVRKAGGRIAFAPTCLVSNPIHGDWRQAFDFVTRQLVAIRLHDLRLWWLAWVMVYPLAALLAGLAQLLRGQVGAAAVLALSLLPVWLGFYLVNEAAWQRLRQEGIRLRAQPLRRQIVAVLALAFLHPAALVRSGLTRRFTWRQQRYAIRRGQIQAISVK